MKKIFYGGTIGMLFLLIVPMFGMSLLTVAEENALLNPSHGAVMYVLGGTVTFIIVLFILYRLVINTKKHFLTLSIIFVVMIILQLLLLQIMINPITDCFTTLDQAHIMALKPKRLLNNSESYFARYTNQYFFTITMSYVMSLAEFIKVDGFLLAAVINIVCIDLSVFLCYVIIKKICGRERGRGIVLLLALCPTSYLFIFYPYTNTYSIPFILGIIYMGVSYVKCNGSYKREWMYWIVFCVLTVFGSYLRPTTLIASIAVFIYILMKKCNRQLLVRIVAGVGMVAILCLGCNAYIDTHLEEPSLKAGFPATHWMMVGLNGTGEVTGKDVEYTQSFPTKSEKINANVREIKKRVKKLGIKGLVILAVSKLGKVWSIGSDDFQNLQSSAVSFSDAYECVYGDNNVILIIYTQIFRCATFFLILLALISVLKNRTAGELYPVYLSLLGIILFLLMWETNKKHNICYIPLMLLLAEEGMHKLRTYTSCAVCSERFSRYKKYILTGLLLVFLIYDSFIIWDMPFYTKLNLDKKDYSYFRKENRMSQYGKISEDNMRIEQFFYAEKSFNEIALHFQVIKKIKADTEYMVSLWKEDSKIKTGIITVNSLDHEGWYYIPCDEKAGSYSIDIVACTPNKKDTLALMYNSGNVMNPFRGTNMVINDKQEVGALSFQVYEKKQQPYTGLVQYAIFFIIVLGLQTAVLIKVRCDI